MSLVNLNDIKPSTVSDYPYSNSKNIAETMLYIPELKCYQIVSKGNFFMHDILLYLLSKITHAEVIITTFSMTEMSARILATNIDNGKIKSLQILMDKDSRKRYPSVHNILSKCASEFVLTGVHAKVLIVKNNEHIYTVLGSHNWTKNPRLEISTLFTDQSTYQFHSNWITNNMNNGYRVK